MTPRGIVYHSVLTYFKLEKGPKFALEIEEEAADLTKALLQEYVQC